MKDFCLLDATPLSLGLETSGGLMTTLIKRNTALPVQESWVFSTSEDNQSAVDVHVLQGERPMAVDNISLGCFRLDGLPPAPRGVPQVEVTFDLDANGVLTLSVRDQADGRQLRVAIAALTGLNCCKVKSLVQEARKYQAEDARRKALAEARNSADTVIYEAGKINDGALYLKIDELRQAVGEEDAARIRALTEELKAAVGRIP